MSDKDFCIFLLGFLFGFLLMTFIYGHIEKKDNELSNDSYKNTSLVESRFDYIKDL